MGKQTALSTRLATFWDQARKKAIPSAIALQLVLGLLSGAPATGQSARNQAPPTAGEPLFRPLPDRPALSQAPEVLRRELGLGASDELRLLRRETDELGYVHERFQQYYQGVKVEHGAMSLHAKAGRVESLSGELLRRPAMPAVQPALSEAAALQQALRAVHARVYKWQVPGEERALKKMTANPAASYAPRGELVLVGDFRQPEATRPLVLAWKFNVYAQQPLSRELVYVDARTGQVVLRDAVIKHVNATGSGTTRYLGQRPLFTDQFGSGYRLRETVHGKGVVTLNAQRSLNLGAAVDFVDNDNNWTAAEYDNANFDNAALDAHVGAQVTQDYWTTVHGRDSFDDKGSVLYSYVHYASGLDNALWDGTAMLYGDGSTLFKPMTAVDICGHEIGHAVCQTTANLLYSNESGALNEGLSDIWGACVEYHLDPTKQTWLIGEDIDKQRPSLRSMSNPNAEGQPDTYQGTYWYTGTGDNGGVHTNSGVLNFWFYLLSVGGSGTNDLGTAYSVSGISIAKAARIVYRAERLYFLPTTTYAGARKATLQAAADLFGIGSAEVMATAKAWQAVGLGEGAPIINSFAATSGLVGQAITITGVNLGTTYSVRFNGVEAAMASLTSPSSVTANVPSGATSGLITLSTPSGTATSATSFTVLAPGPAPVITGLQPASGAPQGSPVTISGRNLDGATAVTFRGRPATFTVVDANTINTTVPMGASSGRMVVSSSTGMASTAFTVLPALTSFSPSSGAPGTVVTLVGTNLGSALSVKFNGLYAAFTVVNATTLTATVPVGATTGPLTVRTPDGTATDPANFVVPPTVIFSDFTPDRGPVGTVVTITGQGFTGTTSVRFNGGPPAAFTVASDDELWATVPNGARSGLITVTTPRGAVTSGRMFEVTVGAGGPAITSFSPGSGPIGTTVVIEGTNFAGATAVAFDGVPATVFTVLNSGRIRATVPAGARSGPISVSTPVATDLSATNFYITPSNDLCADAILVSCGTVTQGSTFGATHAGDPAITCTAANFSAATVGVFYKFIGVGGPVTVNTCTNASYDGQLGVFTGAAGALSCVAGDDDACGPGSTASVTFNSVVGTTYYFYVSGYGSEVGDFTLTVSCDNAPVISSFTPDDGAAMTTVELTGSNFLGASAVRFNGVNASFTLNSPTSITTSVPVGATTGPITVATPAGIGVSPEFFVVPDPLPVTLAAFTARRLGQPVRAEWRTAQELNNRGFEVERSTDGLSFEAVSPLLPAAGTSALPHAYAFTDAQAPAGPVFYRLRQIDDSDARHYSPVVAVAAMAMPTPVLECFPQPAHTSAKVLGAAPGATVLLIDALGRQVAHATAGPDGAGELHLPAGLPAGVYVVRSGTQSAKLAVE